MRCLQAAKEFENRRSRNLEKIHEYMEKMKVEVKNLREYKENGRISRLGSLQEVESMAAVIDPS